MNVIMQHYHTNAENFWTLTKQNFFTAWL